MSEDSKVLGISSAVFKGQKRYQVDGFCHPDHKDFFVQLIQTAVHWCESSNAAEIAFNVSDRDTDKENLIRTIGFESKDVETHYESNKEKIRTLLYSTG